MDHFLHTHSSAMNPNFPPTPEWQNICSSVFGWVSVACWVIVSLPRMYFNFKEKKCLLPWSYLLIWFIGDGFNLAGCYLADQLPSQKHVAICFTAMNFILGSQLIYYNIICFHWKSRQEPSIYGRFDSETSERDEEEEGDYTTDADFFPTDSSRSDSPSFSVGSVQGGSYRQSQSRSIIRTVTNFAVGLSESAPRNSGRHGSSDLESFMDEFSRSVDNPKYLNPGSAQEYGTRGSQKSEMKITLEDRRSTVDVGYNPRPSYPLYSFIGVLFPVFFISLYLSPFPFHTQAFTSASFHSGRSLLSVSDTEESVGRNGINDEHFIGLILGWICAVLYILSRIPQIIQNYLRKRTDGMSAVSFLFSFSGNMFYSASILIYSLEPIFLRETAAWLTGSLGILLLDIIVSIQFIAYRKHTTPNITADIPRAFYEQKSENLTF